MNAGAANDLAMSKSRGWASVRTGACWTFGLMMTVGGFFQFILGRGWLNEEAGGLLTMGAGLCLVPPLLRQIREKFPWARPVWLPVAWFAFFAVLLPLVLSPLAPTEVEQAKQRETAIAAAEQRLKRGDFPGARSELFRLQRRPDPAGRVADLRGRIARAEDAAVVNHDVAIKETAAKLEQLKRETASVAPGQTKHSPVGEAGYPNEADVYVEKAQTLWVPEVNALRLSAIADLPEYSRLLTTLQGLRVNLAEGEKLELTPGQQAVHKRFSAALVSKQKLLLPLLRRRYAELLDALLFRSDVRVSVSGTGARTLQLTGPMFVRNANIEDMYNGLASDMARARFRRVEFRWSARIDEVTYYDLDPPADDNVTDP